MMGEVSLNVALLNALYLYFTIFLKYSNSVSSSALGA